MISSKSNAPDKAFLSVSEPNFQAPKETCHFTENLISRLEVMKQLGIINVSKWGS